MMAVTGFVSAVGATVRETSHYLDRSQARMSLRVVFAATDGGSLVPATVRARFAPMAQAHAMNWQLFEGGPVRKTVMVSRFGHCLLDLVHDAQARLLPIQIDAVVSNY